MAEFAYNKAKYASIGYTPFMLNFGYHLCIFYEKDVNLYSRSKEADELTKKHRNLMDACRKNLQHVQKLQKRAYNKRIKPKSYASGKKV